MNVSELLVARELIEVGRPRGWVLADAAYDSGAPYEQVASYGGCLLAIPRKGAAMNLALQEHAATGDTEECLTLHMPEPPHSCGAQHADGGEARDMNVAARAVYKVPDALHRPPRRVSNGVNYTGLFCVFVEVRV